MYLSDKITTLSRILVATDQRKGNGGEFEDYTGAVTYTYKG